MAILAELQDPRVRDVTVTYVEVSDDLRHAKVHVSVMGDETRQNLSLRGLQNAAGFLQSKVAKRIDTRYTPRLAFVLDQGVKRSIEVAQILKRVLPPTAPKPPRTSRTTRTRTPRKMPRRRRRGRREQAGARMRAGADDEAPPADAFRRENNDLNNHDLPAMPGMTHDIASRSAQFVKLAKS